MRNFIILYSAIATVFIVLTVVLANYFKYSEARKRTKLESKGEEKIYKYLKEKYPDSKIYRNVFFKINKDQAIRIDDVLITKRAVYLLRSETRNGVIWMEPELKGATFITRKTYKLWTEKTDKKKTKFLSPYRTNESPRRLFNAISKGKIPFVNITVFVNDNVLICDLYHLYDDCTSPLKDLDKVIEYWEEKYPNNHINSDEAIGLIRRYKRTISRLKAEKIFQKKGPYILC